jgi:hypothetical protein
MRERLDSESGRSNRVCPPQLHGLAGIPRTGAGRRHCRWRAVVDPEQTPGHQALAPASAYVHPRIDAILPPLRQWTLALSTLCQTPLKGQGDLTVDRIGILIILGFILTITFASTYAQQTVYKWVDEDGVVHFDEEPPKASPDVKVTVITTDPSPPPVPRAATTVESPPPATAKPEKQSKQMATELPSLAGKVDITETSLQELDRRCEDAREAMIAPLREAEIVNCIQTGTGDQAWCETFWADYGAPVRTKSGSFTPGLFYDLPECVDAWNERNRRGLYPE